MVKNIRFGAGDRRFESKWGKLTKRRTKKKGKKIIPSN